MILHLHTCADGIERTLEGGNVVVFYISEGTAFDLMLMGAIEKDLGEDVTVVPFHPEDAVEDFSGYGQRPSCVVVPADSFKAEEDLVDFCEKLQKTLDDSPVRFILVVEEFSRKLFEKFSDRLRVLNLIRVDADQDYLGFSTSLAPRNAYLDLIEEIKRVI